MKQIKKTQNILNLIGNTPLLEIDNVYAKAEFLNPSGSIKDRIALEMVNYAERKGVLKKKSVIVEPTTGNTGISLSMVGRLKGYKVKIIMPENMSVERIKLMRAFGANVILVSKKESMKGSIRKAKEISKRKNYVMLNQFTNGYNVKAHEKTGKEILKQVNGSKIDAFVAGIGTGGTLMGVSKSLKKKFPKVKIFGVFPYERKHGIQGIGDGVQIKLVDWSKVDDIIRIKTKDAVKMSKELQSKYGILAGISSGANVLAARKLQRKYKNVVTVLPDRAERYLSNGLFK